MGAIRTRQGYSATEPSCRHAFETGGERGDLVKILWHDGVGMSLYAKRLEGEPANALRPREQASKFIWPVSRSGEAGQISAAQLGYLLEGIGRRNPETGVVGLGCSRRTRSFACRARGDGGAGRGGDAPRGDRRGRACTGRRPGLGHRGGDQGAASRDRQAAARTGRQEFRAAGPADRPHEDGRGRRAIVRHWFKNCFGPASGIIDRSPVGRSPAALGHSVEPVAVTASLHFSPDREKTHPNRPLEGWQGVLCRVHGDRGPGGAA